MQFDVGPWCWGRSYKLEQRLNLESKQIRIILLIKETFPKPRHSTDTTCVSEEYKNLKWSLQNHYTEHGMLNAYNCMHAAFIKQEVVNPLILMPKNTLKRFINQCFTVFLAIDLLTNNSRLLETTSALTNSPAISPLFLPANVKLFDTHFHTNAEIKDSES